MARHDWTMQALHLACAMARNQRTNVTLVRMIPVQHIAWLGTEFANTPPTPQEHQCLRSYDATAEDYGVQLSIQSMQYVTLTDALVEAATYLEALAVFANIPPMSFPYWRKFQVWNLQRRMTSAHRMLYTLDQPASGTSWVPSVSVPAHK